MRRFAGLLTVAAMTIAAPAAAQSPVGNWQGTLDAGAVKLRVVVHITQNEGVTAGTLDSPDQGSFGIPLGEISAEADALAFSVPLIAASYSGKWDEAEKAWKGEFRQGGGTLALTLAAAPPPEPLPADWQLPGDAALREAIDGRIGPRQGQGMVVGVLGPQDRRIVGEGPEGVAAFDGRTVFEIGSISKVFTALILADMANKGELSLDDPAAKYLPAGHRLPERNGRQITLRDLSTHTSGLPRLPDNLEMADPEDPYADYTEAQMLAFLDRYELPRDVGSKSEYSNLGVGLLGYLLGRAAGKDYETLLRERITGPLGMADTSVTLSPAQAARFPQAFDTYMRPAKPWNLPTLTGAGSIRSTAEDMLKFAAAALDPNSPIGAAMKVTLANRVKTDDPRVEQALGWQVIQVEEGIEVVQHGGGTGGFRTQISLQPAKQRAVVALTNAAIEPSTADIALHALIGTRITPTGPVPPAPPKPIARTEVALPVAELERVTGRYEFAPGVIFNVTRDGNALRAQREGSVTGPLLPIFAEAPLKFFWRAVDAQVTFTADESGRVTGAVFTEGGQSLTGKRLEP